MNNSGAKMIENPDYLFIYFLDFLIKLWFFKNRVSSIQIQE